MGREGCQWEHEDSKDEVFYPFTSCLQSMEADDYGDMYLLIMVSIEIAAV